MCVLQVNAPRSRGGEILCSYRRRMPPNVKVTPFCSCFFVLFVHCSNIRISLSPSYPPPSIYTLHPGLRYPLAFGKIDPFCLIIQAESFKLELLHNLAPSILRNRKCFLPYPCRLQDRGPQCTVKTFSSVTKFLLLKGFLSFHVICDL